VGISQGEPCPGVQIGETTTCCNWPWVCIPKLRGAASLSVVLTSLPHEFKLQGAIFPSPAESLIVMRLSKAVMSDEPFFFPAAGFPRKLGEVPIGGSVSSIFPDGPSRCSRPSCPLCLAPYIFRRHVPKYLCIVSCAGRVGPARELRAVSDPASMIPLSSNRV
jgi:hypothetical protein